MNVKTSDGLRISVEFVSRFSVEFESNFFVYRFPANCIKKRVMSQSTSSEVEAGHLSHDYMYIQHKVELSLSPDLGG